MIEVGDLVKRIALLSVVGNEFGWAMYDFPDDIGIVLAVEVATYEGLEDESLDTGSFIKVMWQNGVYDGGVWHWSEELSIITKIKP
tara:strand:- start:42 stop:299 length:258 start_codon:yes stop_codon:yes gene_type:complete